MNARLIKLGERIRSNLWLIPALCSGLAAVLASVLIAVEQAGDRLTFLRPWVFTGGAESARTLLSTIAGSMITVAGTLYSITFVVLVLASQQFSPRVLRGFMRDRTNQIVLGFFVATFTYCLLVLRAIRSPDEGGFVPHTAVTVGMVLALISLGMLIYFIDHLSHGIHVSSLLTNIAKETIDQIDRLYPQPWAGTSPGVGSEPRAPAGGAWDAIRSAHSGYLQYIDYPALLGVATQHDLVVRVDHRIGDFIIAGTPLCVIAPAERPRHAIVPAINAAVALGTSPTLQEDIGYGVRQIVDVALKAISPAVNDPTTALNCIDQLGVILLTLANREMPGRDLKDARGIRRVIVRERTYAELARLAVAQITHYGASDPVIVLRLAQVLAQVAAASANPACRRALHTQLERIARAARRSIQDADELKVVETHLRAVQELLAALPTAAVTPGNE